MPKLLRRVEGFANTEAVDDEDIVDDESTHRSHVHDNSAAFFLHVAYGGPGKIKYT